MSGEKCDIRDDDEFVIDGEKRSCRMSSKGGEGDTSDELSNRLDSLLSDILSENGFVAKMLRGLAMERGVDVSEEMRNIFTAASALEAMSRLDDSARALTKLDIGDKQRRRELATNLRDAADAYRELVCDAVDEVAKLDVWKEEGKDEDGRDA